MSLSLSLSGQYKRTLNVCVVHVRMLFICKDTDCTWVSKRLTEYLWTKLTEYFDSNTLSQTTLVQQTF